MGMLFSAAFSSDSDSVGRIELPAGLVVRPHAYGHFEAGQIENGTLPKLQSTTINTDGTGNIFHEWNEDALASVGFSALYKQHLKFDVSVYAKLYFSYPQIDIGG